MTEDPQIVVIGNRLHSKQIIQNLLDKGWDVVGVIGFDNQEKESQSGYTSFNNLCEQEQIPLVETSDITEPRVEALFNEISPDVCICCGWTQIIPKSILETPTWGTVGLHLSPLPEGRGGAPVNWQIIHGFEEVTATLFCFVPEVDHGDILGQTSVPLEQRDDISTVYPKLTIASIDLLHEFLTDLYEQNVTTVEQSYDNATYYPQRKPKDGLINWNKSSEHQWNWIRAQTHPYPGAFTFCQGQKLTVWQATVIDDQLTSGKAGEIINVDRGIDVQTGNGVIRLERVQLEGFPEMWADNAAERHDLSAGMILGHSKHFPDWLYTGIRDADGGLKYKTNVSPDEPVRIRAVCCSHSTPRNIQIEAYFDGEIVLSKVAKVDGWFSQAIEITPTNGPHTLRVVFKMSDGSEYDTRFLKIYTPEEVR